MTSPEHANVAVAEQLTAAAARYAAAEISATEFIQLLATQMTDDVTFSSNYTPTWEPLRPLFAPRRGLEDIVERYRYENEHEAIAGGTGIPFDLSISGDVLYYTQRETAAFFDKPPVTWEMVTKIEFSEGKIASIRMFLDSTPIEAVYGSARH